MAQDLYLLTHVRHRCIRNKETLNKKLKDGTAIIKTYYGELFANKCVYKNVCATQNN